MNLFICISMEKKGSMLRVYIMCICFNIYLIYLNVTYVLKIYDYRYRYINYNITYYDNCIDTCLIYSCINLYTEEFYIVCKVIHNKYK